jgi:hypothetical protein
VAERYKLAQHRAQGLVDVLDRILDKGLVIAGDIKINLANVELLTVQIRLLVCSIDKAEQIGMNWWRTDPHFGRPQVEPHHLTAMNEKLDILAARLEAIENKKLQ